MKKEAAYIGSPDDTKKVRIDGPIESVPNQSKAAGAKLISLEQYVEDWEGLEKMKFDIIGIIDEAILDDESQRNQIFETFANLIDDGIVDEEMIEKILDLIDDSSQEPIRKKELKQDLKKIVELVRKSDQEAA